MPGVTRRHVVIRGRVQGVFFRDSLRSRARELGVNGWARNAGDGSVEAVFEGSEGALDALVAWSRQGPPRARVDEVEVSEEQVKGEQGFSVW
ncbi:MAG TPA: acylphosphatase [Acidimicrobiia bacterium]|jgi:acylphosphatase